MVFFSSFEICQLVFEIYLEFEICHLEFTFTPLSVNGYEKPLQEVPLSEKNNE